METTKSLQCLVCGSKDIVPLEEVDIPKQHALYAPSDKLMQERLTETARASALRYQMMLCKNCGLEFAYPPVSPNAEWYNLAYRALNLYPDDRWEFPFVIQKIKAGDTVLELACGSGEFLKVCKANSIPAKGLDFASDAVNQCKKIGLDADLFDLTQPYQRPEEKAANITAFHILEHLSDPNSLFRFASQAATKNTRLWVSLPSNLRPSRMLKQVDFLDQPPHHMSRWSKKAFAEIGKNNGWILEDVFYEPIPDATIIWWITTRIKAYRSLQPLLSKSALLEKAARAILYPFVSARRGTRYKDMTGFTMLALYSYHLP